MGAAWLRVNKLVGAVSIPALAGLVAVAPDFIPVVLGSKWESAVRVIQILAWVGLLANSLFVDTLHWRHLWLVAALIWAGWMRRSPYALWRSSSSTSRPDFGK